MDLKFDSPDSDFLRKGAEIKTVTLWAIRLKFEHMQTFQTCGKFGDCSLFSVSDTFHILVEVSPVKAT